MDITSPPSFSTCTSIRAANIEVKTPIARDPKLCLVQLLIEDACPDKFKGIPSIPVLLAGIVEKATPILRIVIHNMI